MSKYHSGKGLLLGGSSDVDMAKLPLMAYLSS